MAIPGLPDINDPSPTTKPSVPEYNYTKLKLERFVIDGLNYRINIVFVKYDPVEDRVGSRIQFQFEDMESETQRFTQVLDLIQRIYVGANKLGHLQFNERRFDTLTTRITALNARITNLNNIAIPAAQAALDAANALPAEDPTKADKVAEATAKLNELTSRRDTAVANLATAETQLDTVEGKIDSLHTQLGYTGT